MFIFHESNDIKELKFDDKIKQTLVEITSPLSFSQAIVTLAMNAKRDSIISFVNFFSIGCEKLTKAQIRGLERIMLGEQAIELCGKIQKCNFIDLISLYDEEWGWSAEQIQAGIAYQFKEVPTSFGIGAFIEENILIVGESPGKNSLGYNTPFVGSGSGQWLLNVMEEANIDERRLYWINAKDGYGNIASYDFLKELKPSKIIALGKPAFEWALPLCTEHKVSAIAHPQYWRRFRSNEEYKLIDMLEE